ncbi:hypothetical protein LTR64_004656 [Lithohypha guttulata]|uniref:Uncharacterized protein n=1 Tax=Lithohypha guttulata TaxID=1690604 RepID=A0AAN7T286_9EURO|nr:hypothetical protein LTR51_006046 [Lithohypha guttulata]KAK5088252.1 hypothetical protein LTR05_002469 [Lithohypha guttulata]
MPADQYYEKVAGDDSGEPLVGEGSSRRVVRAPPTKSRKRSTLTKVALGAVFVTIFVAAVGVISSAVVSYRLPAATEAALAKQQGSTTTSSASSSSTGSSKTAGMGMGMGDGDFDGMDTDAVTTDDRTPSKSGTLVDESFTALWNGSKHQELRSCGGTPDEARAAGCVFDVMMQLWTPPECMDTPLSERFLEAGNWTWYADGAASRAYTDEEIRKGEHDVVYVAQSYHRHHCIFAWERLVRAMRNQAPLIEELISYDHVMHCRHKTLTLPEEGAEQVRGVVAPTGYTKCASYDVWIQNLPLNKMSSSE